MDMATTLELLTEWEGVDEDSSFAAICPVLEGHLPSARRSQLHHALSELTMAMQNGANTGTVKAAITALVENVLATLKVTWT